jgi:hypothetical protein
MITTEPETLTLDQAVARARAIQRDVDAGRLAVPYPADVHADLAECVRVFAAYSITREKARELIARLEAPELPW